MSLNAYEQASKHWAETYDRMAAAIQYLIDEQEDQPSLNDAARHIGLTPQHFQRVFSHWTGLSPKQFVAFLTLEKARQRLLDGETVLSSAFDAGLSGPSRLHDLAVTLEAATPGEIAAKGEGLTITSGITATPFGDAYLGWSDRGLMQIMFVDTADHDPKDAMKKLWPRAWHRNDDDAAQNLAAQIFTADAKHQPLKLWVRGTNWQVRVWRALLDLPFGGVTTYGHLADQICSRKAARAVGNAVGSNPLAPIIPCHRVIRESGALGGYRWGLTRKRALLASEQWAPEGSPAAT